MQCAGHWCSVPGARGLDSGMLGAWGQVLSAEKGVLGASAGPARRGPSAAEGIQGACEGIRISVRVFSVLAMQQNFQEAGRGIQVAGEGIQGDFKGIRSSVRVFCVMAMPENGCFTSPNATESG